MRLFAFLLLLAGPAAAEDLRISAEDFIAVNEGQAALGRLLFYDPVLSGNRNISCGTCHHHDHGSSDGLSLGLGEGGHGLGPDRAVEAGAISKRIPRNAPGLWNLGHRSIRVLFHDGRLEISDLYGNGFDSPAEEYLPPGLANIVAAQALFPLTAEFEMAGQASENDMAASLRERIDMAWPLAAGRVAAIPAYRAAFADLDQPVTPVTIANALGAFIIAEWQSHDSPFDAWLEGTPLPEEAERGRVLFFGEAACASCHSGPLFTDQEFHALALPAFGPGRTRRFDPIPRDTGRMAATDRIEDAYRFRTPSLRNVALTAPYGHNGAYPTLEGIIRHHVEAEPRWTPEMAKLPAAPGFETVDFAIRQDRLEMARQAAVRDTRPLPLTDRDIADLEAFLHALTGRTATDRPFGRPETVPSGLPVD